MHRIVTSPENYTLCVTSRDRCAELTGSDNSRIRIMDIQAVAQCLPLNGMAYATPGTAEKIPAVLLREDSVYTIHSSYR